MPSPTQKNLARRSPVIVVMGHIDHGKSSLLDYIRKSDIVAGEAGGITQHVGAYEVEHVSADGSKRTLTFLDTPGHEAFCSIRERGAMAADIAILVVSGEDGVKPQTIEAMNEIRAAKIPFIVAINKTDKPNADIERTKTSLSEHEIYVEGWGGDVPCVAISALKGTAIPELLDLVILSADLAELTTDPTAPASGVVIESKLDTRKGISATLIVKNGTLKHATFAVAGSAFTPIRFIEDFTGTKIENATASQPVIIVGWNTLPACGASFSTVGGKRDAEKLAGENRVKEQAAKTARTNTAAALQAHKKEKGELAADQFGYKHADGGAVILPLVIKADVIGSLEGVKFELDKITAGLPPDQAAKVKLKIVSEGIGEVSETDVKLAQSDPSILLVGFNEEPDKKAASLIERSPVPLNIRSFKIIYELTAYVRESLLAKIPKEYVEVMIGRAKILAVFSKEKDKQVVGGKVQEGMLETGASVRIMRRDGEIGRGTIRELQQQKKRVSEINEGYEFGTMIEAKAEIAEGDKIEAIRTVEKA